MGFRARKHLERLRYFLEEAARHPPGAAAPAVLWSARAMSRVDPRRRRADDSGFGPDTCTGSAAARLARVKPRTFIFWGTPDPPFVSIAYAHSVDPPK